MHLEQVEQTVNLEAEGVNPAGAERLLRRVGHAQSSHLAAGSLWDEGGGSSLLGGSRFAASVRMLAARCDA